MTRVASLGMYDHPAQHRANDTLWQAIAHGLADRGIGDLPDRLDRGRPVEEIWRDPALLLAQACGYPLTADDAPPVRIVALPTYAVSGCERRTHHSVVVARAADPRGRLADFRGATAAVNAPGSNTGMNLLRATIAPIARGAPFLGVVRHTGSHHASAGAVAHGDADLAAIDAVTWAALRRHETDLTAGLRIVTRSVPSPGLPFVTAAGTPEPVVAALRIVLAGIAADPTLADVRDTLLLRAIDPADADGLTPIREIERDAARMGYPSLA